MNCKDTQEMLSAYADGEVSEQERLDVEEHLSGCAECRAVLEELLSMDTLITSLPKPKMKDMEAKIMATIGSQRASKNRKILRPVLATMAVFALVATFAGLHFSGVFMSPEAVLAKAYSVTENLRSFRMMDDEYVQTTENSKMVHSWHSEIDYAGNGRLHAMKFIPNDALIPYSHETIVIGSTIYYKGNAARPITPEQLAEIAPSELNSLKALDVLSNVEVLPDETIDGVDCYHYTGLVDIEKWLEQGREDRIKRLEYVNEHNSAGVTLDIDEGLKRAEDFWRTRQLTYDFWISKDDYRVRQWTSVEETAPGQTLEPGVYYKGTYTFTYYDFNEEIDVEPPLDDSGALLPGWNVQTVDR